MVYTYFFSPVLLLRTLRFPETGTCETTDELAWVIGWKHPKEGTSKTFRNVGTHLPDNTKNIVKMETARSSESHCQPNRIQQNPKMGEHYVHPKI